MTMNAHKDGLHCVLVSSREWHNNLPIVLRERTGNFFELIADANDLTLARLKKINPTYVFFLHWSHRIDRSIFDQFECVIFHMTDVPFGRGGSPLQNLIARGMSETKISALRCVEELDAGPVYLKKPLSLYGSAEEIFIRSSSIVTDMIVEILEKRPTPIEQVGEVTMFRRRKPEQGDLAVVETLEQAFDLIRMLDAEGYPSAFVQVGSFLLEFSRVAKRVGHLEADVRITLINDVEVKKHD